MPPDRSPSPRPGSRGFQQAAAAFLLLAGLPFPERFAACEVGNRERPPRTLRAQAPPHGYKLMLKPRHELRSELHNTCT